MLVYRLMQRFLRLVVSVFFRNIEIIGKENIPTSGGVIFVGNHPNSLMDPLLVITQSGRVVHFAAKDVLFRSRFLRIFLNGLGAVPIRRRMDHAEKGQNTEGQKIDNQSAFDALFDVLAKGGAMGIFPEGISHTDSQLSQFKTGAARIALGVLDKYPDQDVTIVPVGLTYLHRHRFRSQVLIHFGEAIEVDQSWQDRHKEDAKQASRELTDHLEEELRSLTLNAPNWHIMRMLHTARRLYKPDDVRLDLEGYTELTRRFSEGYERNQDDPQIQAIMKQLEDYQNHLDYLGLRDHDLRKDYRWSDIFSRLMRRFAYLLILLPLALPGFLLHLPIILTAVVAGDGLTARKDVIATTKLVASILTVPLLYLVLCTGLWFFFGWRVALFTLPFLPLTGFATIRVLEQQFAIGKSLTAISRLLHFQDEIQQLRDRRQTLAQTIDHAVEQFHDRSIPRMFEKTVDPQPQSN